MTTEAHEVRALTRRGHAKEVAGVWRPEETPFDTAPANPAPDSLDPSAWGRSASESAAMLRRAVCPICGEGPWGSPLNHVSKKHGIRTRDMREACGLTTVERLTSDQVHATYAGRPQVFDGTEAAAASRARQGGPRSFTKAGRAAVVGNLSTWMTENPELHLEAARTAARKGAAARATTREASS